MSRAFVDFSESLATLRARQRGKASEADACTFNFVVSNAEGDDLEGQVRDAEEFVRAHVRNIAALGDELAVESMQLDFMRDFYSEDTLCQVTCFSAGFLTICAEAGLDVAVSVYAAESPNRTFD